MSSVFSLPPCFHLVAHHVGSRSSSASGGSPAHDGALERARSATPLPLYAEQATFPCAPTRLVGLATHAPSHRSSLPFQTPPGFCLSVTTVVLSGV
jgi:hypothetical protein